MMVETDSAADLCDAVVGGRDSPAIAGALRREHACRHGLLWRSDVAEPAVVVALQGLLGERCRRVGPAGLGVELFETTEGHGIVLVPRTGRLQLRIVGTTAREDREPVARALHRWLFGLVGVGVDTADAAADGGAR